MRILAVGPGAVARRNGGGERFRLTIEALKRVGEVRILLFSDSAPDPALQEDCGCSVVWTPSEKRSMRMRDYSRILFRRGLPRRLCRYDLEAQKTKVRSMYPQGVDLVWCYGDLCGLAVPDDVGERRGLDIVDYEGHRDVELVKSEIGRFGFLRSAFARLDAICLRKTIDSLAATMDVAVISSELDADAFSADIGVVPNGYRVRGKTTSTRPDFDEGPLTFLFVGTMQYPPNKDAACWLVRDIWPRILEVHPDAELRIVGRNPPRGLPESRGLVLTGEVSDVQVELDRADVVLVPLRFGSGTRIKVLEAWANGLPVVTTTKGVEGLPFEDRENVLIADSPSEFADAALLLSQDPDLAALLRRQGRATYLQRYSADSVIDGFEAAARLAFQRSAQH